jgi:DNA-binding protein Fis
LIQQDLPHSNKRNFMLDILETHLKSAASPELSDAITEACDLFETYELPGYQDAYTDLLLSSDNLDIGDLNTNVVNLTLEMQSLVLEQMLISTSEDSTVRQRNLLLKGLRLIETTEFNEDIIALCTETDTDEALCEIISTVTGEPVENLYQLVSNVDRCVLDRIQMVCQQNSNDDTISPIDTGRVRKIVERLISYKDFVKKPLFIYDYILNGQQVDCPFEMYYTDMWDHISALRPYEKATELYAAALISDDGINPKSLVTKMLTKTHSSIDEITPIVNALEDIIVKFKAKTVSSTD